MRPKNLTPAGRVIVAADFSLADALAVESVTEEVMNLADDIQGTDVYVKLNSILRLSGYSLIDDLQAQQLRVFADLKLFDISATLANDGILLRRFAPEILTASCASGVDALKRLNEELPETEILGVTVLTTLTEQEVQAIYGCTIPDAVLRLAEVAAQAGIDGLVCAPTEVGMLRERFGDTLSINTPGVRPVWANVKGDDQNLDRVMTPEKAVVAGADRVVIGRPIIKSPNRRRAIQATIDEIAQIAA
ncbi:orotidine-5'-phosphate decarboxylase [Candidatus Kaiserbacteria bacterium]|nr:MAG: orotidine-5'-phosphate decarboxylase [Candidatus Kaiserbacteria bacterium]